MYTYSQKNSLNGCASDKEIETYKGLYPNINYVYKESKTKFKLVRYDHLTNTSILKCI